MRAGAWFGSRPAQATPCWGGGGGEPTKCRFGAPPPSSPFPGGRAATDAHLRPDMRVQKHDNAAARGLHGGRPQALLAAGVRRQSAQGSQRLKRGIEVVDQYVPKVMKPRANVQHAGVDKGVGRAQAVGRHEARPERFIAACAQRGGWGAGELQAHYNAGQQARHAPLLGPAPFSPYSALCSLCSPFTLPCALANHSPSQGTQQRTTPVPHVIVPYRARHLCTHPGGAGIYVVGGVQAQAQAARRRL